IKSVTLIANKIDDMIYDLQNALQGRGGAELVRIMRRQYKVGLIDEFQDTDVTQYEIFRHIFTQKQRIVDAEHYFFMVGDPKQAIYSFRNGDLHTYFRAKRELIEQGGGKFHTLTQNFRSTPELIAAVNHIFVRPGAFATPEITYLPVTPGGRVQAPPGAGECNFFVCPAENKSELAKKSGDLICHLLRQNLVIPDGEGNMRPLSPGDIAVLLRKNFVANELRYELTKRNIPSVCAKLGNVFDSSEAMLLRNFLLAVFNPTELSGVLAALTGDFCGESYTALTAEDNSPRLRECREQFFALRELWDKKSFQVMYDEALSFFQVKIRLLLQVGGERAVSNLLQLGEILQQQEQEKNLTHTALIRFLEQQCAEPDNDNEFYNQILETDLDAVKIMTIHTSKGLEFPICILPDLGSG
ncbi:MAG: UvrD-helicase domain-containing protein, partial [Victivallaceae bacterium]